MPIVVEVAFKPVGPMTPFAPGELDLRPDEAVIVESAHGSDFGFVKTRARAVPDADAPAPLRRVLRRATPDDWARRERSERRRAEAFRVCQAKIAWLDLPMKLIEAEWAYDGSQVTFHFVADGRVDFRDLVREMAHALRTRVQMHQVGARDEAKLYPGIGPCGRPTCCSTFLREFAPVSIKMVRGQSLAMNPSKFTGLCGKLMCCLRYEHDEANPSRPALPQPGMVVMTPLGRAKVEEADALRQMLTVQLENQQFVEVRLKDIGEVPGCVDHAEGGCQDCASDGTLSNCTVPTRDKPPSGPSLPVL
ncbi:MAG: stage 0 sporulation protein [Armatimonadetes bacterium]|nr:stage 0 sporulation protein [Armatimonadota bacterium]